MNNEFLSTFRFVLARSEGDKQRVFALRHRVFCEELSFFSLDLVDRVERDAFDAGSLHCLVEHRETGIAIGCLRVVMAEAQGGAVSALPVEEHCRHMGIEISLQRDGISRHSLCEISRVAIPRFFRTGGKDDTGASELEKLVFSQHDRRMFATMGIALNLCATALSGITERFHVLAFIEPRFQRLLARVGLRFEQVSPTVNLLGLRAAFYINQQRAELELSESVRPLYEALLDDLSRQYNREREHSPAKA